ncbi:MAG: hypothetical protein MUP44_07265 [Anaerolineales bacterium]|nr:hypothetical protein [Anaerolineales bacterium]
MGTWGTGLYSDDTACDVRNDYRDILGDGISEPEATKRIIAQWKRELSDSDIAPVFWLALADVQWRLGRLQESVKKEALTIIENGSDLARWHTDKKLEKKRKIVLMRLGEKLNKAQPEEKKVKKRYINSTDWNLGDVYSFKLQSGKLALIHVIGFHQDKGGRGPVCEILDWTGDKVPDRKAMKKMGYIYAKKPYQHLCQFLFGSLSEKDFKRERVSLVAKKIKPKQRLGGYSVIFWRSIDDQFDQFFIFR